MPVVFNTVANAAGTLLSGTATIDLIVFASGNNPTSFQGFVDIPADTVNDYTINTSAAVTIDNGAWSATLRPNADIEDAYGSSVSTYYKVTERTGDVSRIYYILVPSGSGPYWSGDLVAIDPATFGASVAFNALSDVDLSNTADGDIVHFEASSGLWKNVNIPSLTNATYKDILTFSAPGILTGVTGTMAVVIPYAFTITSVNLHVEIPPTGNSIYCDANVNGSSIFTSGTDRRPRIASGANTSTFGAPSTGDTPSGIAGRVLSIDIDEVGLTGSEGQNLTVSVGLTYT